MPGIIKCRGGKANEFGARDDIETETLIEERRSSFADVTDGVSGSHVS